ncbi:transcription initiation factor [Propionibacterium freudenreichii]|jgi:hypothetical protein|nr:transcription initiation factor [Propionibacterium freudenreichii]
MSEANGRVLVCPNCGSPVSDDDVTCPVCGVDLRGADLGGANLPRAGNDTAAAGASSPTPTSDTQSSGAPSSTTDSPDAEPTISVAASPDSTTPVGDKASGPATSSAVSAQDWRDYFQLLNGRAPTEAEFQRAVADGAARPLQAAPTFTESGPQGGAQASPGPPQQATMPQLPLMGQPSAAPGQQQAFDQQQPVGAQQFASQQQFFGQQPQMAGQPLMMTAPVQPAADSAFVAHSKGYWAHLKQAWLHPTSIDATIKDGYAWVTYGIILAAVVITLTYQFTSVGNFFKALILFGGAALLLTVVAAALTRVVLNVRCTFTDMLKLGTQSVIPLMPITILFMLNDMLLNSRVSSFYGSSTDLEDLLSDFSSAGSFFVVATLVLLGASLITVLVSVMIQGVYFYRLSAITPGSKVDRYGWLVVINTVMVMLLGIIILLAWFN